MRIYWFWPHPHRHTSRMAEAVTSDGDELVVHALSAFAGERLGDVGGYRVVRDLPDPVGRGLGRFVRPFVAAPARARARRRLLREGFDVAHVENLTYEVDAFDLPRLARRVPIVAVVHDVAPHRRRWPRWVEEWLRRRVYGADIDLVVYHEELATMLRTRYGVPDERLHVLTVPLDARRAVVSPPEGARQRVLLFGTLRENKGVPVLLEAAGRLPDDVEVVIAGHGPDSIEVLVRGAPADRVTHELGRITDARKWDLFAGCHAVVLPYTHFAAQSGVLADAYSAGRPVVASDVGALGPTVRADGTGIVVPPGDPVTLAAAITEVLARRDEWAVPLAAARARHDEAAVGRGLLDVYRAAVRRRCGISGPGGPSRSSTARGA